MKKYGLVGFPIGHSFSGKYFTELFDKEQIEAKYYNYQMESIQDLHPILNDVKELAGLNITIPHKTNILPFLDEVDEAIHKIGAVNVVRVTQGNGKPHLKGYNTDVIGFEESVKEHLKPHHKKALILGTGGASKAVVYVMEKRGIEWKYVSRKASEGQFTYEDITPEVIKEYTLIINCTPLGMSPKIGVCADLPYSSMGKDHYLYDLVYNPDETQFLINGQEQGATTKNGLDMLHIQADAAWEIWNR